MGNDAADDLGIGPESNSCHCTDRPVRVPRVRNIIQVSGGGSVIALQSGGHLWTWGADSAGQGGNGKIATSGCRCQPYPVRGPSIKNVVAAASGGGADFAVQENGRVWAWGLNDFGHLGLGTVSTQGCQCIPTPTRALVPKRVISVSASYTTTSALTRSGQVWTWGGDQWGQVGNGTVIFNGCGCQPVPQRLSTLGRAVEVTVGDSDLALLANGRVMAWGASENLGTSAKLTAGCNCLDHPAYVQGLSHVVHVSNDGNFKMALLQSGVLKTWGDDANGQLGMGHWPGQNPKQVEFPQRAAALRHLRLLAALGDGYSGVALTQDHKIVDWGDNFWGELGRGYVTTSGPCSCNPKVQAVSPNHWFTLIATADRAVFALRPR